MQSTQAIAASTVQKSIPRELERQQIAIENLESRLSTLRDRLTPVMSHKTELKAVNQQSNDRAPRPSAGCEAADSINAKTHRIEDVLAAVDEMIDRLEI